MAIVYISALILFSCDRATLFLGFLDMSINIIGKAEYEKYCKTMPCRGTDSHYFHYEFVNLLKSDHDVGYATIEVEDPDEDFRDCIPEGKGIYFCCRGILYTNCEVWYVGKTNNFIRRWGDHHKYEALKTLRDVEIYFLPLDDYLDTAIDEAERGYIDMLTPVFNGTSKPDRHLRQEKVSEDVFYSQYTKGFDDGYIRASQDITDYFSQEIMRLHSELFKLKTYRSEGK